MCFKIVAHIGLQNIVLINRVFNNGLPTDKKLTPNKLFYSFPYNVQILLKFYRFSSIFRANHIKSDGQNFYHKLRLEITPGAFIATLHR